MKSSYRLSASSAVGLLVAPLWQRAAALAGAAAGLIASATLIQKRAVRRQRRAIPLPTRELRREIVINAPADRVWATFSDTASYADWNPFIPRLRGTMHHGEKLDVRITPPGTRGLKFRPTVVAAEPGRELRWMGRFLVPGLFDGEHSFKIEPIDATHTRFVQSEVFTGVLVGAMGGTLEKTERGFEQMNEALRARAESLHTPATS